MAIPAAAATSSGRSTSAAAAAAIASASYDVDENEELLEDFRSELADVKEKEAKVEHELAESLDSLLRLESTKATAVSVCNFLSPFMSYMHPEFAMPFGWRSHLGTGREAISLATRWDRKIFPATFGRAQFPSSRPVRAHLQLSGASR